mgnify:CR=1 FL=1
MIKPADCIKKYGEPTAKSNYLGTLVVPDIIKPLHFPSRIYCNYDMHKPLLIALELLKEEGLDKEILTYDGCFNIRKMRGASSWSLHSWAVAIDLNAFENQMYTKGKFTSRFVMCWKFAGFDWGGDWTKRTDPMHFQLKAI